MHPAKHFVAETTGPERQWPTEATAHCEIGQAWMAPLTAKHHEVETYLPP